ncbi:MAG: hypothetical protein PHI34_14565 [Acidobacteriota bacterium]|nr:hypothetical protein [Acidobacteriota bacterium]
MRICRSVFDPFRSFIPLFLVLAAVCGAAVSAFAVPGFQAVERKLRVKVENAAVHLKPGAESPVIAVLKLGTVLTSYEAEGAWCRIVPDLEKEAVSMVGYIAVTDVEVLKETAKVSRDFWSEESTFAGIGLDVFLTGGYILFGGGDLDAGTRGLYDEMKAMLTGLGYAPKNEYHHDLNGGGQFTIGFFWRLRSRLAVGVIGDYGQAQRFNKFEFADNALDRSAYSTPVLRTFAVRPALRYGILAGGPVDLAISAGPAVFFSSFQYDRGVSYEYVNDLGAMHDNSYYIKVHQTALGAFAALDLDVRLNARAALVLQAAYRYVHPAGWEGTEKTVVWSYGGWTLDDGEIEGRLYSTTRDTFPILMVSPENPGSGAAEAALDSSGFSLNVGVRVRF